MSSRYRLDQSFERIKKFHEKYSNPQEFIYASKGNITFNKWSSDSDEKLNWHPSPLKMNIFANKKGKFYFSEKKPKSHLLFQDHKTPPKNEFLKTQASTAKKSYDSKVQILAGLMDVPSHQQNTLQYSMFKLKWSKIDPKGSLEAFGDRIFNKGRFSSKDLRNKHKRIKDIGSNHKYSWFDTKRPASALSTSKLLSKPRVYFKNTQTPLRSGLPRKATNLSRKSSYYDRVIDQLTVNTKK